MKGVVYLLTSIETGMGYVGSTINLTQRLWRHRSEKYNNCTSKLLGRFTHLILEEVIDDNITDEDKFILKLALVERAWQDLYWDNLVNDKRSRVTYEESKENKSQYYINNIENIKEKNIQYYKDNQEHCEEIKKIYYLKNRNETLEYKKSYYNNNKERLNKISTDYYTNNKDKVSEWQKANIICECGKSYTQSNKSRHIKTKNHQEYLTNRPPLQQSTPDTQ